MHILDDFDPFIRISTKLLCVKGIGARSIGLLGLRPYVASKGLQLVV